VRRARRSGRARSPADRRETKYKEVDVDLPRMELKSERGQHMYETAIDCPYSGLNSIIAVAVGKQEPLGVTYDVYQIL